LTIVDGRFFVHVWKTNEEQDAIDIDKEGIYMLNAENETWQRITPKIDDQFKVSANGCTLTYKINKEPFRLNVCSVNE